MRVYESKYIDIEFWENQALLTFYWTPQTFHIKENDYKVEFLKFIAMVEQYRPHRILGDLRKMGFAVSPEIQDWMNAQYKIPQYLGNEIFKAAFIISEDIFVQTSVEQVTTDLEKTKESQISNQFFTDRESALEWLFMEEIYITN